MNLQTKTSGDFFYFFLAFFMTITYTWYCYQVLILLKVIEMKRYARKERQDEVKNLIAANPFITDEELAKEYNCSIQTIRLDRLLLGIPEVRERMRTVAEENYKKVKSAKDYEIVGELLDIELDSKGSSLMVVIPDMVSDKNNICRGHHIYAQASMLALSMADAEIALTGSARVRYKRPVYLNEKLVAKAFVAKRRSNKLLIKVVTRSGAEEVFTGKFIIVTR